MSTLPQGNKHQAIGISFLFMILVSCAETEQQQSTQTLDFNVFTIEVPASWGKLTGQGLDSYVGGIVTGNADTISFDFGRYSNSLSESGPFIMSREVFKARAGIDSTDVLLVGDYRQAKESAQYKKQNLLWDSIDGREAKIVYPGKAGIGVTGVYFDSVWTTKSGTDRLRFSGTNLNQNNQKDLLHAIQTIRFKSAESNTGKRN